MSFIAPLSTFVLGLVVGGIGGIILGFVWYERKCGLLSDRGGKRAAAIRFELDDVFGRPATTGGDERYVVGGRNVASPSRMKTS